MDLGGSTSDGLIWLDTERGGFVSRSVPVVLCADVDVVDEVRKLQREIVRGRCGAAAENSPFQSCVVACCTCAHGCRTLHAAAALVRRYMQRPMMLAAASTS